VPPPSIKADDDQSGPAEEIAQKRKLPTSTAAPCSRPSRIIEASARNMWRRRHELSVAPRRSDSPAPFPSHPNPGNQDASSRPYARPSTSPKYPNTTMTKPSKRFNACYEKVRPP